MNSDPDYRQPFLRDTYTDPGCWHHGEEPIPQGAYRVCGECWHCYNTAENLVQEHNKILASMRKDGNSELLGYPTHESMIGALGPDLTVDQADQIYICPLCTHDF